MSDSPRSNAEAPPETVRKLLRVDRDEVEINLTPGESSIVVWMTTDHVDREREVILPEGIDFRHYLNTNPVVMAIHDYHSWPVGTMAVNKGGWIKLKKGDGFKGLVGKVVFDTDADSQKIYGKYKRDMARMVSVGVEPPVDLQPGEWGPPTTEELSRRPDWQNASRIIRRCVLTELSLCPIGMNPNAVVISKAVPVTDEVRKMIDDEMAVPTDPDAETETAETKALETPGTPAETETVPNSAEDPVVKLAARLDALEAVIKARMTENDGDGDEDDRDTPPHQLLRAGHYVEFGKGMSGGCGKILSIHRSGRVPGVAEEIEGTEDEPAAKVKLYRVDDAGKYRPTATCQGMACKDLTRIPHPLDDEPEANPDLEVEKKAVIEQAIATLTSERHRTLAEVKQDLVKQLGTEASRRAVEAIYVKRGGI